MIANNRIINIAYQFLAEALLIFLLAVPFMQFAIGWRLYGFYLLFLAGIYVLFLVYTKYTTSYLWFIVSAPFFMAIFYMTGFKPFLSIALPAVLTVRFISLRREVFPHKEKMYINITIIWTIVLLIWLDDYLFILYACLILMVLFVGHIISHIAVIEGDGQHDIRRRSWRLIGAVIASVAAFLSVLFIFRHFFTFLWESAINGIIYLAGLLAQFIGIFIPEIKKLEIPSHMEGLQEEQQDQENEDLDSMDITDTSALVDWEQYIFIGVIILVIALIIFFIVRYFRSRFRSSEEDGHGAALDIRRQSTEGERGNTSFFRRFFKQSPEHRVRKLIYQLEHDAAKADKGRHPYETLEQWMDRLGFDIDMTVYEKVRYGGMEQVSDNDFQALQTDLANIRRSLRKMKRPPE